jgi:16S rRNA (guanine(966)-N(2))-methyltransferase RsmD
MSRPRILGGSAKGRELDTPRRGTRPSPARLREALFDILAFEPRGPFLDLYAGSGALGLEAASRGWDATCVDLAREAVDIVRRNAARVGLEACVVRADALAFAREHPGSFAVVAAAPPYPEALHAIFQGLLDAAPARPGGLYVFQHPSREEPALALPPGHEAPRVKRYGSNALTLVRRLRAAGSTT